MNTQPEALRLAEIGQYLEGGEKANWSIDVCAELRRLHAANVDCVNHFNAIKAERDALLEALRQALAWCEKARGSDDVVEAIRSAIAKVTP